MRYIGDMPFGLIFGAVFYGVLCLWLGSQFLLIPWGPARTAGMLLWLLGVSMGLGLLLRQGWARWAGALGAAGLSILSLWFVALRGLVFDNLVFMVAVTTTVLLFVPATGNVRRGLSEGASPSRRVGRLTGITVAGTMVGFLMTAVWAWNAPAPAVPLSTARGSIWSPGPKVDWSDFGEGLAEAKSENKLILVDFFASCCGPCHQMDRITFRDPDVAQLLNEEIVAVRVDSEETVERHGYVGLELAEEYEIWSYPTVALLDADGDVIARRSGYLGPERFLEWLTDSIERADELKTLRFAARGSVNSRNS